MKRRNHEEVYTSSTRSSPRGKRLLSWLLSIVMLLSLLPGMELHAHAFWDDYDDGFDCPNCDHYHFGSDYMCDCLFCTIDCNYECWVETHCNDCGVCFGDTPYWCEECYKCAECMEEKHCSTCAKCYIGEDDQLCGECHKGPCCSITICDSCGFCDDCANDDSDPMHCSLCNACFGAVDECVDDDDTGIIHCVDCHTACEQCEECLLAKESCEDCGLCKECCEINSEDGGCPDGETCVESAEWDEHICLGCDGWVTDKGDENEFCETCELCKECCEGNSDCSEGMCAMHEDYAEHFCEDCGLCFHDSDPCENCDQRCKDCCLEAVSAMGCDCDDRCFSDSDFENHLNAEHPGAEHTHTASATWSADGTQHWHPCRYCDEKMNPAGHEFDTKGVCKVCGYISGSAIVITRQPRDVKCKTSIYDDYKEEPENGLLYYENNPVTFSVSAKSLKGDELTYQWYRKNNEIPTAEPYKLPEGRFYTGVTTSTLKMPVSTQACQEDYSYYCVIGRKGDPSDTMKTAEAKLTATHAYSYQQAGEIVYTDDGEKTPEYKVTWVDTNGVTHDGAVGGVRKSDGHKLPCLFEAGAEEYEAHYMTTGSKERIFPHKFKYEISYDAVGGGRVDMLVCTVCDYTVPVKSHVHDYGWNWDYAGFEDIYHYTFNIGGSTKTVEQLILESGYAHPEKCKVPGCEEFIMVPHSWGRWNVVLCPDTAGAKGGMEAECSVCEYKETKKTDGDWTKDTALVTVKNGRATRMIVKPGDKIRLYPEERTGQKAIGWKVEYLREYNEYNIIGGTGLPVTKNWDADNAKTLFQLVTDGSALEWGCTIPAFSAMGAPGGGQFFFEPVYEGCDHSGSTTVLNAKAQVCDRKGYTGDTACADCGYVISAGSDIYPPADAGHTGTLQPLYYYGTSNSATTDASHGGKRYNARSGDCRHRAYEGDYRCTACGGTVKGETGDFKHSGPFELRDVRTATCTEKGYSGNQYCTACNRIAKKGTSTKSLHELGSNSKLVNKVEPSCTAAGYSGDQQCTGDCGQIFRYGHVIDKLSHDWNSGEPATQGKSEGILYTCQRCGETKFVKNAELPEHVGAIELTVTAPKLGETPGTEVTDVTNNGNVSHFTVRSVSWNPAHNVFKPHIKYTISVVLEAEDGYTFAKNSCKINGEKVALEIDSTDKTTATAEYTFAALIDTAAEKYQLDLLDCSAWYMDGGVKVESAGEDFCVPAGATVHLVADSSFQEDGFCRWVRVDDADDTTLILNSRSLTGATLIMPRGDRKVGPENHEFTQEDTANPAALVRPATCTTEGIYYLSCSREDCYAVDRKTFSTPALGHEFGGAWLMDESDHWQLCQRCFAKMSEPVAHNYDTESETPNTCTTCGYQKPETDADACEHKNTKLVNVKAPTCLDKGYTGDTVCEVCGVLLESGTPIGVVSHQFSGGYKEYTENPENYHGMRCSGCGLWFKLEPHDFCQPTVSSKPKCNLCGYQKADGEIVRYLVTFFSDGELWYEQRTVEGGVLSYVPKAPQKSGYRFLGWYLEDGTKVTTSTVFGGDATATAKWKKIHSTGTAVSATTYPITVMDSKNGDVTASHKSAAKGTTITLTVDPDKGYVLDTLTVLDGKDKEIKLTEKNGKYTFTMPASKVTVEAAFKASAPTGKNPFVDVPAGSYYEDAVVWAVGKGITTGTSATTFNPNGICTRAQAVTFLWRAAGSPAPKTKVMSFTDVPSGSYYETAVLWAMEQGITKGTSDTMFSPNATCTRAQIVTFLWRANGSPVASGNSAFTDVASDAYYAAAVTWAEKNYVTGGIGGGLFGSNNNCTRAQIVTFIYRSVK